MAHRPHQVLWRVREATAWTGGRAWDGGGHRIIGSVHTQERCVGVSAAQVLLGAEVPFGQQNPLPHRPALSGRRRWTDGRPRVAGRALPKLRGWTWNGTDRSASVRRGGVDTALGAIHVLFSGEKGWGRGIVITVD